MSTRSPRRSTHRLDVYDRAELVALRADLINHLKDPHRLVALNIDRLYALRHGGGWPPPSRLRPHDFKRLFNTSPNPRPLIHAINRRLKSPRTAS
jgi:hypothetical protein